MEIVGTGDWAKAWESFSRLQPNHFFHICTWSPSTKARVSRADSFHFHQWVAYNCQDQTFPSDLTTEVRRLSHSVYSYGRAQENWGTCKNTGWRISRITFPFIFPQDKRTAQDTVICQTPKQNKTGLLLIQTNGHSCRKVSTWNLTVLNSRFAVLWSLFQDSFFPQCLFMLTICSMWQDPFCYMYFWQHCIPYFPFSTFGWHSSNSPSIRLTVLPPTNAVKLETQVVIQLNCRPGVLRVFQMFDCILVKLNCLSWLELLWKWESQAKRTGVWSFKAAIETSSKTQGI